MITVNIPINTILGMAQNYQEDPEDSFANPLEDGILEDLRGNAEAFNSIVANPQLIETHWDRWISGHHLNDPEGVVEFFMYNTGGNQPGEEEYQYITDTVINTIFPAVHDAFYGTVFDEDDHAVAGMWGDLRVKNGFLLVDVVG